MLACCFYGTPNSEIWCIFDSFAYALNSFSLTGSPYQALIGMLFTCHIVSCFTCLTVSLEGLILSEAGVYMVKRENGGRWGLRRVEGKETVVRIYCIREESIFNLKSRYS